MKTVGKKKEKSPLPLSVQVVIAMSAVVLTMLFFDVPGIREWFGN